MSANAIKMITDCVVGQSGGLSASECALCQAPHNNGNASLADCYNVCSTCALQHEVADKPLPPTRSYFWDVE